MRVWGNRSLGCRPASTQKRAAGFGRQTKVCSPSATPKGDGAPIAPRPRRSGPRVSGGNLRIARPQPLLKARRSNRPASTRKRAAGFGRQFKNCSPSAAPKGDGAPIAPRPRESGPRVSGGNLRIARPQPLLKARRSPERLSTIRHCRPRAQKTAPLDSVPHWAFISLHPPLAAGDFDPPFRSLNRRGGSLPLVSVDSRGSLRPKSRSCHWQAGHFAPPPRKPIG